MKYGLLFAFAYGIESRLSHLKADSVGPRQRWQGFRGESGSPTAIHLRYRIPCRLGSLRIARDLRIFDRTLKKTKEQKHEMTRRLYFARQPLSYHDSRGR